MPPLPTDTPPGSHVGDSVTDSGIVNMSALACGKGTATCEFLAAVTDKNDECTSVAGTEVKCTSGCMFGNTAVACFSKDGATVDPDAIEVTSCHPTDKVLEKCHLRILCLCAAARAFLGAMLAEKCVAPEVMTQVGVCQVHSTEEFTVVVTGVDSFAEEFIGLTATDTGGGIIEAVATVTGGTAALQLTCTVGDEPDQVTSMYACDVHNSVTGECMVEDTKTKAGLVALSKDESDAEANGCDATIGSFKIACTESEETCCVSNKLSDETVKVAKDVSDVMFFDSVLDSTHHGTPSIGGGVSSCGSDACSCDEIGALANASFMVSDNAANGRVCASEVNVPDGGPAQINVQPLKGGPYPV